MICKIKKAFKAYGFKGVYKRIKNRISYFFYKSILRKTIASKIIHGSRMYLDLRNKGISKTLWIAETREDLDVEIVKEELTEGMNVLEAGANIGYYLLIESKILAGGGKIYAFEPDPRNLEMLKINVEKNKLEKMVDIYPYAVSDKDHKTKFYIAEESNLNTMVDSGGGSDKYIDVEARKIDGFEEIEEEINFIRMDIEGYEYEAIRGMMETIKKSPKVKILVEVHPNFYTEERDFTKVAEDLFENGFRVKYITSAGYHSPKEIIDKGYVPKKISRETVHSRGLYENIKNEDFVGFIKNKDKIVRSVLFVK
jgi:FkbM family methyltransferase